MANPTAYDQVIQTIAGEDISIAERHIPGINNLQQSRLPSTAILKSLKGKGNETWIFPSDLPKHYFIIQEYKWLTGQAAGQGPNNTIYLPMPAQIIDNKQIHYNEGFNLFTQTARRAAQGMTGSIIGTTGLGVNNMNSVTLDIPDFQKFTLDFHLAPKSPNESLEIDGIVKVLKKYSHPVNIAGRSLLGFPSRWQMAFVKDDFLFKFKPCVIENIQVTYPNNFFKANNTVPESVQIHLQCKELEVWLDSDFPDPSATAGGG